MERKWRVLIVVCVAVFMLLLDITVVNVALPDIGETVRTAHAAFISGLNEILLVASFVLFGGAVLAFLLVRRQEFVASGPALEGG